MNVFEVFEIPIDQIKTSAQVREVFDEESIAGLAGTIREVGVQQPIRLQRDRTVVDGERRLRAAIAAGLTTVPCVIEDQGLSAGEVIHRQLVANCQRENLTPLELARAIEQLMQSMKWSPTETAQRLGLSPATISRAVRLLTLPEPIQAQVESGQITASAAYQLAQVEDEGEQTRLAKQVAEGRMTRDALSGARKNKPAASSNGDGAPSRVMAALGSGRSITVSGPGLTLDALIAWLDELLSKAKKVRPQGLELSTFVKMLRDQAKS